MLKDNAGVWGGKVRVRQAERKTKWGGCRKQQPGEVGERVGMFHK